MGKKSSDNLVKRITDQQRSMGKVPNVQAAEKRAQAIAEKADRKKRG